MQHARPLGLPRFRSFLLALVTLAGCAAANPAPTVLAQASVPRGRVPSMVAATLIGRHALAEADMDVASDAYQRMLAADPENPDLQQRAFVTTLLAGRPDAVRVARFVPGNQAAVLLLAGNDAREGNWKSAETRFGALPNAGIFEILRPLLLAWTSAGAGRPDAALDILRPLADGQRLRGVFALNAAMIADLAGDNAEAGKFYRLAHAEFGGANLQMARLYASWLTRQGNRAEADKVMLGVSVGDDIAIALPGIMRTIADRQIRQATDGIAEVYLATAGLVRGQDNLEFPSILLRLALALKPDMASARITLAELTLAGRHPEQALPILAPIGLGDPLDAVARARRAGILASSGKADAALAILNQLSIDLPGQPLPFTASGGILRAEKRFAEAAAAYDRAIALIPAPTRAHWGLFYERGIALDRDKQWARAEADLLKALELYPDQPFVLNYLGYSWTEQDRNIGRARQMIERAAALRPNDGAIIDSLGWIVLKQGEIGTAVRHLERAVELEPTDATITAHLGDAYWAAGRKLEAGFQWRRALTLSPDAEEVAKIEAKIAEGDRQLSQPQASR